MKTLFINCKLWQPDESFDEAFGINGDLIDFTGTNKQAESLSAAYYKVIDLGGKLVLPALTDGHLHLTYGSMMRKRLDCRPVKSAGGLKELITSYSDIQKNSAWIIGSNLNMPYVIDTKEQPVGNIADEFYSDKPLFIANYDYHSALCNTKAFEASGLIKKLDEFGSELVLKDKTGRPTGIIKEEALDFVFENIPEAFLSEKTAAVKDFIRVLHSYGITTVSDITLPGDLDVYKNLFEDGELKFRINSYIPFEEFPNLAKHREYTKSIDDSYFTINGFKAFYDGALGSASALFSENYKGSDSAGVRTLMAESGELKNLAKQIDAAKEQCIIHAIGDKAVTEVLDICEELIRTNGQRDRRLRIEHAQHINPKDFERFMALGVIISAQPVHLKYDIKLVKDRLPDNLIDTTHNYKRLMDDGVVVNFGTDFPIVEVNPFDNIQMAVTRNANGDTFTPEYCIPLHECIKSYTIYNAYSNFNAHAAGSVTNGKVADFVIMEDDLFLMEPERLSEARVHKTFLAGKEVYSI